MRYEPTDEWVVVAAFCRFQGNVPSVMFYAGTLYLSFSSENGERLRTAVMTFFG